MITGYPYFIELEGMTFFDHAPYVNDNFKIRLQP